jgi:hypothetical protein
MNEKNAPLGHLGETPFPQNQPVVEFTYNAEMRPNSKIPCISAMRDRLSRQGDRQIQELAARRSPAPPLNDLKIKRARLIELSAHLQSLSGSVGHGADLERQAAAAARQLVDFRGKEHIASTIWDSLDKLAGTLSQPLLKKSEPSSRGIERLRAHIESTEERLSAQNANRTEAISVLAQMTDQRKRRGLVENDLRSRRSKTTHSPCAKEEPDRRRSQKSSSTKPERPERALYAKSLMTI